MQYCRKMVYSGIYEAIKILLKTSFTLYARSACIFMPFLSDFSFFAVTWSTMRLNKIKKHSSKKLYNKFRDINSNCFYTIQCLSRDNSARGFDGRYIPFLP